MKTDNRVKSKNEDALKNNRIEWLDMIRGLCIIAVVVCHQQGILHTSEYIQFLTLYSVTGLIFAMGFTKGMSLTKHIINNANENISSLLRCSVWSMKRTLLSYVLVTIVVLEYQHVTDFNDILSHILSFDALPPLYFIRHYIVLTLWSPILFFVLSQIIKTCGKLRYIYSFLILLSTWIIGYISISKLEIFCQSYFFVYTFGMLLSIVGMLKANIRNLILSMVTLMWGGWLSWRFYFERVAGNYSYNGLIDILDSKLQLNPPNISVILYTLGVIFTVYNVVTLVQEKYRTTTLIMRVIMLLGRYSLDIFLWHYFILNILTDVEVPIFDFVVIKRIVFYSLMFGLPIIGRGVYERIKKEMHDKANYEMLKHNW